MNSASDPNVVGSARRVCFFAHFHAEAIVADHVIAYLQALKSIGFTIVIASASAIPASEAVELQGVCNDILVRENTGLDFGGWIDCCRKYFPLRAEYLLFANDSVYAPIGDLAGFFDRLIEVPADFYGAVESGERDWHLQSWFLMFRPSAYRSEAFRSLMLAPMPPLLPKAALIERYEIGLSQRLAAAGLSHHAAFSPLTHGGLAMARPYNPMHLLWDEVLMAGVPFIKVETLRADPLRAVNNDAWREAIARSAPLMGPLIEADLTTRGRASPPSRLAMTDVPAINWPEVRFLVRRDFHRPLRWPAYLFAYRAIVAMTRGVRRWLRSRES